jgi:hypothetical protein
MTQESEMNPKETTKSEIYKTYLGDTGRSEENVPKELVRVGEQFSRLRQQLEAITFEMVSADLGENTPHQEKHGYWQIGKEVVRGILGYLELGALIAVDPLSLNSFGSPEKVAETAQGFLEEAQETAKPSYLIKNCSAFTEIIQEATETLKGTIASLKKE